MFLLQQSISSFLADSYNIPASSTGNVALKSINTRKLNVLLSLNVFKFFWMIAKKKEDKVE